MTNEEAILWLVSIAEHEGEQLRICAEDAKALQMGIDAIKALEQQPCETIHGSTYGGVSWGGTYKPQQPCEDCISREEALRLIDEERQHLLRLNMDGAEHIIVHYARRIIEDMPSASSVDCIDRQKTIAEIQYKYYDNAVGIDIVDMIAHMPAAIPEQLGEHFAEGYKKGVENE